MSTKVNFLRLAHYVEKKWWIIGLDEKWDQKILSRTCEKDAILVYFNLEVLSTTYFTPSKTVLSSFLSYYMFNLVARNGSCGKKEKEKKNENWNIEP